MKRVHKCSAGWVHHCPGCSAIHVVPDDRGWTFNGDYEQPTFQPSVRLSKPRKQGEQPITYCHYIVTDGKINYCADSTHSLAGQTIVLPPWTDEAFW